MAKVIMLLPVSGVRDAQPWAGVGDVMTVPKPEADELIASGIAKEWKDPKPPKPTQLPAEVETATMDVDSETPEKKTTRTSKASAAKKKPAG